MVAVTVRVDVRALGAGVAAVAVVGAGFGFAIGLRVEQLREHPIADHYGTLATVVVTPTESPRSLSGNRMMFRGTLHALDGNETPGRDSGFRIAPGASRS